MSTILSMIPMDEVIKKLPVSIQPAAALYSPVIARMALSDVAALINASQNNNHLDALKAIRQNMTVEELAAEAKDLADMAKIMARDSYESRVFAASVIRAILAVGLSL